MIIKRDLAYYKSAWESYFQCSLSQYNLVLLPAPKGAYLCYEGTPVKYLLFFMDGKAKVFRTRRNGSNLLYDFYEPLSVLGDMELFCGDEYYQTTVQALTACTCLGIPLKEHREQLLQDITLLRIFGRELGKKLNGCAENAIVNQLETVAYRLGGFILKTAADGVFKEHLGDTAELLGVSYRHLLRTLKDFCDKGILAKGESGYIILDQQRLNETNLL